MDPFLKKTFQPESEGVSLVPPEDNRDPRFQAQSDEGDEQQPQKVQAGYLFQYFKKNDYPQEVQKNTRPKIHFLYGGQNKKSEITHEDDETNHVMIKKKSQVKTQKMLKDILGFIDTKQAHGNDKYGEEWIKEQQQRQDYRIVKGKRKKYIHPENHKQNQVIYIEPSVSEQRLRKIRGEGKNFEDEDFPPVQSSLQGQDLRDPNWDVIKWKRASSKYPDVKIFVGKIQPYDIKQGFLGDCYFLAGVAAIAERPDRIMNLFLLKKRNELNYYSIKMLYKGKWRMIDLDENVPSIFNKPAFGYSVLNQLWVILLQKAWAKLYGSYKHIQSGFPEEPLHDLTGAPIKHIFLKNSLRDPRKKEENWRYLIEASQKEYAMVASSNSGSDTQMSQGGIAQGHAYTFLNATTIKVGTHEDRIVQLRNPWGKGQFKGDWSDFDTRWNYVSQEEKARLQWKQDRDDGLFFMTYNDFMKEFRNLTIAEIDDNASYVYKSYYDPESKGAFFRVDISHEGNYSFQVDKTPERTFTGEKQRRYQYPETWFEVGKLQQNGIKKSPGSIERRRTLFRKQYLQPGVYIVWVNIKFDPEYEKDFEVTLAIYAQYCCEIKLATREEAAMLKRKQTSWDGLMRKKSTIYDPVRAKSKTEIQRLQLISKDKIQISTKEDIVSDFKSKRKVKIPQVNNNSSAKKSLNTEKESVNTKSSKKVKKVRKTEYHTSKVEVTRENPHGQKVIKTQTCENKKQTLKQYMDGGSVSSKIKEQEKIVKEVENQYHGETLNKVENFEQKLTCTFEKPDGEIIRKVNRKEGKIETLEEEGEESEFGELMDSDVSIKRQKEEQLELKHESEIQKRREQQKLELSDQQSLPSEEQNRRFQEYKNKMKEIPEFANKNVVYMNNSDQQEEKRYDPDD